MKRDHAREEALVHAKFEGLREAVRGSSLEFPENKHCHCLILRSEGVRGADVTLKALRARAQVNEYHMQLAAAIDQPLSARDLNVM